MKYGKEDKMNELTKTIVENGITYVLGMDELYYPDLPILPNVTVPTTASRHHRTA